MFKFFFSDQGIIFVLIELLLFNFSTFYVLFLYINNMSPSLGIFHRVDMVIWFIKVN